MSTQYVISCQVAERKDCSLSSIGKNAHQFYPYYARRPGETRDDAI